MSKLSEDAYYALKPKVKAQYIRTAVDSCGFPNLGNVT
jgi:hypothetical protein